MTGTVTAYLNQEVLFKKKNTITTLSTVPAINCLSKKLDDRCISVSFGTSSEAGSYSTTGLLGTVLLTKTIQSVIIEAWNKIRLVFVLGETELVGEVIKEIGLFSKLTGTMFSRLTITPGLSKSYMSVIFHWDIEYGGSGGNSEATVLAYLNSLGDSVWDLYEF